jgi:hypothetical protein
MRMAIEFTFQVAIFMLFGSFSNSSILAFNVPF